MILVSYEQDHGEHNTFMYNVIEEGFLNAFLMKYGSD
jgi:hypothetical protein